MIEPLGGFVLVHVATSLEECERRDRKGLYAKARAGILKQFTGISDPYEEPKDASLVLQTEGTTPEEMADQTVAYLKREGYLG
jgi:sulfate adenylyltransferase